MKNRSKLIKFFKVNIFYTQRVKKYFRFLVFKEYLENSIFFIINVLINKNIVFEVVS